MHNTHTLGRDTDGQRMSEEVGCAVTFSGTARGLL